jgi:hypothetical protein
VALAIHGALSRLAGVTRQETAAKPLTTQFVKRQPRLTKPLEMKKRPRPKQRRIERRMVAVKARSGQQGIGLRESSGLMVRSLARPTVGIGRTVGFQERLLDAAAISESIEGSRETKQRVDMGLEMLDIEALDTGQYHAMVIQDPTDKKSIRGFLHLKYAYSANMRKEPTKAEDRMVSGLVALVEAVNRYTSIKARFGGRVAYDSSEILKTPWIFSAVHFPFKSDEGEAAHLGEYLMSGGFLFVDAPDYAGVTAPSGTKRPQSCLISTHHMLQIALEHQGLAFGKNWDFETLRNDHPLYHCYFDFDGAPGAPWDREMVLSGYIQGVCIGERWLMILSQKYLLYLWHDPHHPELRSERMIQFGVNTIIFALTQEGSITKRVMDSVTY